VLARGDATGSYEVFIQGGPEGAGPPPHLHGWDESYYVLSGQLEVMVAGQVHVLSPGEFIHVPGETVHNFRLRQDGTRFLSINSRAGAAAFFEELHQKVSGSDDISTLLAIAQRHEVRVPPPPGP
jgi:quercetin dioxygenase-like cupin family protein